MTEKKEIESQEVLETALSEGSLTWVLKQTQASLSRKDKGSTVCEEHGVGTRLTHQPSLDELEDVVPLCWVSQQRPEGRE